MDQHAGLPGHFYSTSDHLQQLGIDVVECQAHEAEEDS